MNTATLIETPVAGETRRTYVVDGHRIGSDAIVDFGDIERPGRIYQAAVLGRSVPEGLGLGDACLIRYRPARKPPGLFGHAGWEFVRLMDDDEVENCRSCAE